MLQGITNSTVIHKNLKSQKELGYGGIPTLSCLKSLLNPLHSFALENPKALNFQINSTICIIIQVSDGVKRINQNS